MGGIQYNLGTMSPDSNTHAPLVHVRIKRGNLVTRQLSFEASFSLGRADGCSLQFADENVSSWHASVSWENGAWRLTDLMSTNGVFVGRKRIEGSVPLPLGKDVRLGRRGPVIIFSMEAADIPAPGGDDAAMQKTQVIRRYFKGTSGGQVGERTMLIREAFLTVRRRYRATYWGALGAALLLLAGAVVIILEYRARVEHLQKLHATAAEVFYTAKAMELQIAKLRAEVAKTNDAAFRRAFEEKEREEQRLQSSYGDFLDDLGISQEKLSPEDWQIYRVARIFGECDVSMPPEFLEKVKEYIRLWQRGHRLARAVERAGRDSCADIITGTLLRHDLPPQFLYLAVQESGLDTLECGPETRSGIAKGMWQFIPKTAWKYGLKTGPLIDVRRSDPMDERHNFRKSTEAAARYLRDIYDNDAQASGLLVMACYNWDETKIREMLNAMPEDPRRRNFWNLLARHTLPEETYDYVFYIISAAVIGENPRLFGFDFDNPLPRPAPSAQ